MAVEDPNLNPYNFTAAKFMAYVKPKKTPEESAHVEWEKVIGAARRGKQPEGLSDAAAGALRSIGGIRSIGDSSEKNLQYLRKNFTDAMGSYTKSGYSHEELPESVTKLLSSEK